MKILGIETSCDDTGLAIIEDKKILFNKIIKQNHDYGVIPEFAARQHHIALKHYLKKYIHDVDLIAYTKEPGLVGSLFVGASFAKGLALGRNKPLFPVNHLTAHCLLPVWLYNLEFPSICFLISGGHTMLIKMESKTQFITLATTLDDALGETFDKIARHIGLGYPGGPEIENLSKQAVNKYFFEFPNIMQNQINFSFSGLKTAAMKLIKKEDCIEKKADFCLQFQQYIANLLQKKIKYLNLNGIKNIIIAGGVSANLIIRSHFKAEIEQKLNLNVVYLPLSYCTDNGLMIAATAQMLFE